MRYTALLLILALAGCGGAVSPESATPTIQAAPSFEPPDAAPAEVIEGLDGQAFMGALDLQGFACGEPQQFTTALQQWNCTLAGPDAQGPSYEVIILGESPAAVHSIDASVDQLLATQADPVLITGFLSLIAITADFSGADPVAASEWVAENAKTESVQLERPGVTYNLRGPAELRGLEIVATE